MKLSGLILFIALAITSVSANAWFFFWLPLPKGNATASPANLCIKDTFKAGESITSPLTGNTETVKSVYGASSRCNQPGMQLADVEFSFTFNSKVGIDIPDEYEAKEIPDFEKFNGKILNAVSKTKKNTGIIINSRKMQGNVRSGSACLNNIPRFISGIRAGC